MYHDGITTLTDKMTAQNNISIWKAAVCASVLAFIASSVSALEGAVMSGGLQIDGSEVTLWQAGQTAPTKLASATTKDG